MRSRTICIAVVSLPGFQFLLALSAQSRMTWRARGGWGGGSAYNRLYDPQTVETIRGEVVSIDEIIPAKGMSSGIHVLLKTDQGVLSIHLGPRSFVQGLDVAIELKDRIQVKGSRIAFRGAPTILGT